MAIDKIHQVIQQMDTRRFTLSDQIQDRITSIRVSLSQNNRTEAMNHLKMKKIYEKEIERIYQMKFQLEHKILMLEQFILQQQVFDSSSAATQAMKETVVIQCE
eukprot:TRINITY_DN5979_c0_g1_i2.p1 TRINITY_DN5979_c0_g1~~TRINITY_DN5979_c0_g1_i2.p1  ORF type:complete len:117 (-),score=14.98 TRINITY_DN5979_c0_g1_i2:46-357(-)